ncbi:MAG: four helix bundle protein [Phycisphaerae bacterium]|nr:four helix bundle protein [Phycisphaerae bacterium]
MEQTRGYKDLIVWRKAMDLVPLAYRLARKLPREETWALGGQIRRAVISIPANIAEGQARRHRPEFIHFLSIARGSLAELDTLLLAATRLDYFRAAELEPAQALMIEVRRLLQGLIQKLQE